MQPGNNLSLLPSDIFKVSDKIPYPETRKRGVEEHLLLRRLILLQAWILQALSTPEPALRSAWILGMPSLWKPFIPMLTVSWLPSSAAHASVPLSVTIAKECVGHCAFYARLPCVQVYSEDVS